MRKCNTGFQVKAHDDDTGTVEGYGSVFGVLDDHYDIVDKGAYTNTIEAHQERGAMPKMLAFHDMTRLCGVWDEIREDDHGLWLKGHYLLNTQEGREQYELAKGGALDGLSIGFTIPDGGQEWDEKAGANRIKEIDLWEVSLVPFPANTEARLTSVKNGRIPTKRELEKTLRDAGLSNKQSKALLAEGYNVLAQRDAGGDTAVSKETLTELENLLQEVKGL